jgi:hypothetical protein
MADQDAAWPKRGADPSEVRRTVVANSDPNWKYREESDDEDDRFEGDVQIWFPADKPGSRPWRR